VNQAQVNAIMAAVTAAMQNASNTEKNDNGKSGFGTHSGEECKIVLSRRVGLTPVMRMNSWRGAPSLG